MTSHEEIKGQKYAHLARSSVVGFIVQLVWILVVGALDLGRFDRVSTWLMVGLGFVIVAIAVSSAFRKYIEGLARQSSLPAQIFVINGLSILLVGVFLFIFLRSNPQILANTIYLGDAVFIGGLFVVVILSLIANLIAYMSDRSTA